MPRPTRALIDLGKLRRNYGRAVALAGPARAVAVVKANGYGHGIEAVAGALAPVVPMFAVALVEEALAVRAEVADTPVLLMQGVHDPDDWPLCGRRNFIPVIHCAEQIAQLKAATLDAPVAAWIKVNTGMNRLGFRCEDVPAAITALRSLPGVSVTGLMTHFACADDPDSNRTDKQLALLRQLGSAYPDLTLSTSNSAAHYTTAARDDHWTRPGIMLYGGSPLVTRTGSELGLEAVMTLESRLIAVRDLQPGDEVGYGADWRAAKHARMGIVAIGYADGYPRHAPSGTPVTVAGQDTSLIGRVSMDMLAVDLSAIPSARPGDRVELWGTAVSIDEVARAAGTISYELLTGVTARVPRVYIEPDSSDS